SRDWSSDVCSSDLDPAEVVVLELLAARRLGAEERAARREQVGPAVIELLVDEEELLFGPDRRPDGAFRDPEDRERASGLRVECAYRPQHRQPRVQRLTGPHR